MSKSSGDVQALSKQVVLPFFAYVSMFVGVSLATRGMLDVWQDGLMTRSWMLMMAGVLLFGVGSFLQKFGLELDDEEKTGWLRYIGFSLLLAIGLSIIAAGINLFFNSKGWASLTVLGGFMLSLIAFMLRFGVDFAREVWVKVAAVTAAASMALYGVMFAIVSGVTGIDAPADTQPVGSTLSEQQQLEQATSDGEAKALQETKAQDQADKDAQDKDAQDKAAQDNAAADASKDGGKAADANVANSHAGAQQSVAATPQDNAQATGAQAVPMAHMGHVMVKDDQEFLTHMIPHHNEAVEASKLIAANTKNSDLKSFAKDVIESQSTEVVNMKDWYQKWFGQVYTDAGQYKPMMSMNAQSPYNGAASDQAYIQGMIAHHQSAVQMAEMAAKFNDHANVKELAQDIVKKQNKEIDWLQKQLVANQ